MNSSKIIETDIYNLIPTPYQPRVNEEEGLEELQNSIQEIGLINKPKVIMHPELPGKYIIQTGHRRIKALKKLKFKTVTVEVLEKEDSRIPLVDNLLRVDLHVVELANAIQEGLELELFFNEEDVVNTTGLSFSDVKAMLKFGGKFPDYIVNFLLENKKYVFSSSYDVLEKLAILAELKPGKKILMFVLNEIRKRESEDGANIKAFKELISIEIESLVREKEKENLFPIREEKEKIVETNKNDEIKDIFDTIKEKKEDENSNFNETVKMEKEYIEEEEFCVSEYENTIKDLGLNVSYDDDWKNIKIKISLNELSKLSATKLLSIFGKIEKKIK